MGDLLSIKQIYYVDMICLWNHRKNQASVISPDITKTMQENKHTHFLISYFPVLNVSIDMLCMIVHIKMQ